MKIIDLVEMKVLLLQQFDAHDIMYKNDESKFEVEKIIIALDGNNMDLMGP